MKKASEKLSLVLLSRSETVEETKECFGCHRVLPCSAFSQDKNSPTGKRARCKACLNAEEKERYPRVKQSKIEAAERWRLKHPEQAKAIRKKRRSSPEGKALHAIHNKRSSERNPEKVRARKELKLALNIGLVQKLPCRECGAEKVEGHHPDYSKPYDVVWLCTKHHNELHKGLIRA